MKKILAATLLSLMFAVVANAQSFKIPAQIPTTPPGQYPSKFLAVSGALGNGTYAVTAKTSLVNKAGNREPSGDCELLLLDANGAIVGSALDDTQATLDVSGNGADTASVSVSTILIVSPGSPNQLALHCHAAGNAAFQNSTITASNLQGQQGVPGVTPSITIGNITTLQPGAAPTVSLDPASSQTNAVLDFGIPLGLPGAPSTIPGPAGSPGAASTVPGPAGASASVSVGSVSVGANPSVTNSGTSQNAVLNFVLPQPQVGAAGPSGSNGNAGRSPFQGYWSADVTYQQGDMVLRTVLNPGDPDGLFINITGGNKNATGASPDPWENNTQITPGSPWKYCCGTLPAPPAFLSLALGGDPVYVGTIQMSATSCNLINTFGTAPLSGTITMDNTGNGNVVFGAFPNGIQIFGQSQVAFAGNIPSTIIPGSVGRTAVLFETPTGNVGFISGSANVGSNGWNIILVGGGPSPYNGCGDATITMNFQLQP